MPNSNLLDKLKVVSTTTRGADGATSPELAQIMRTLSGAKQDIAENLDSVLLSGASNIAALRQLIGLCGKMEDLAIAARKFAETNGKQDPLVFKAMELEDYFIHVEARFILFLETGR